MGRHRVRTAEGVTFGGGGIDRAAHSRAAPSRGDARILPVWRGKPLMEGDGLGWIDGGEVAGDEPDVFLGLDGARAIFARDVSSWEPAAMATTLGAFHDPSEQVHPALRGAFADLRARMTRLSPREAELAATAKALLGWHATHRHCARCGAVTDPAEGGWQRRCPACEARHFPRTDPVVIMLITHGNAVLVGRSPGWPDRLHSLLAGFVEPGETLEAAVRREVREETAVEVGRVRYLASQPWPFPASLMVGCHGEALSREITLDPVELDGALWLSRETVAEVFAGTNDEARAPRHGAIARFLLEAWLADRLDL
jgi:NAD+ diphosphatase